jgi:tripartite-type tricarboxylate transporter receptor subunit TctC
MRQIRCLLAGLAATVAAGSWAHAQQSVAQFYAGKELDVRVGTAAGSGYDLAARLISPFIGRYLPGKPTVVVENEPGAGGLMLMNDLYNSLPRDGTVIAVDDDGMPTAPLLTPETAHFDSSKFGWIGSPAPETDLVMVWHTAPVQTYEDLFKKQLVVGGVAPGTATVDVPLVTNAFAGTKFKIISGYDSTGSVDLAMERGEVQGQAAIGWISAKSHNQAWLRDGTVKIIAQYGFEKLPDLPNVPLFPLPKDKLGRQAMLLMIARQEFGRPFLAPPGVPADRLAALRRAFDLAMKDPEFLKQAQTADFEVRPVSGARLQDLADQIVATDPSVAQRMREVLDPSAARPKK